MTKKMSVEQELLSACRAALERFEVMVDAEEATPADFQVANQVEAAIERAEKADTTPKFEGRKPTRQAVTITSKPKHPKRGVLRHSADL